MFLTHSADILNNTKNKQQKENDTSSNIKKKQKRSLPAESSDNIVCKTKEKTRRGLLDAHILLRIKQKRSLPAEFCFSKLFDAGRDSILL